MIRENTYCYFLRKPAQIASSRGKQQSFLDLMKSGELPSSTIFPWIVERIEDQWLTKVEIDEESILEHLKTTFTEEQEYWLLNRLDTPTQWLMYFAKDRTTYDNWKDRQWNWFISKFYLAESIGSVKKKDIWITFNMPLGHHTNGKKMHVVDATFLKSKRKQKMRGKKLDAKTTIVDANYDDESNTTLLTLMIKKWQRHQIRAHLAYLWYPLVGEKLYHDSYDEELWLWSIWCTIDLPTDDKEWLQEWSE